MCWCMQAKRMHSGNFAAISHLHRICKMQQHPHESTLTPTTVYVQQCTHTHARAPLSMERQDEEPNERFANLSADSNSKVSFFVLFLFSSFYSYLLVVLVRQMALNKVAYKYVFSIIYCCMHLSICCTCTQSHNCNLVVCAVFPAICLIIYYLFTHTYTYAGLLFCVFHKSIIYFTSFCFCCVRISKELNRISANCTFMRLLTSIYIYMQIARHSSKLQCTPSGYLSHTRAHTHTNTRKGTLTHFAIYVVVFYFHSIYSRCCFCCVVHVFAL